MHKILIIFLSLSFTVNASIEFPDSVDFGKKQPELSLASSQGNTVLIVFFRVGVGSVIIGLPQCSNNLKQNTKIEMTFFSSL